jgi:hypothetical protein
MPDIAQMARRTIGRKQHHINLHIIARLQIVRRKDFCGGSDPREATFIYRQIKLGHTIPRFHLYKGDEVPASGNQINLAQGCANAPVQDSPPLEP